MSLEESWHENMDHGVCVGCVSQVLELWAYSDSQVESTGCNENSGTRCEREKGTQVTVSVGERQLVLAHVNQLLSIRHLGSPLALY